MASNGSRTSRKRPTGRRPGDSGTRDAILDAALELFSERGFEGASIRAIAAKAKVDPALIRHFFGDKELLFVTALADRTVVAQRLGEAMVGPANNVGERATDTYLRLWEEKETRPVMLALVRSALASKHGTELFVEVVGARVRRAGSPQSLDDPDASGLALAAAHLFGVAMMRYVFEVPALANAPRHELLSQLAPVIQNYLNGS